MSHQGHEGWFPECLICGAGNLGGLVCLTPDVHALTPIASGRARTAILVQDDDRHWWTQCLLCDHRMLSDPFAWGSVAYCVDCWNRFTSRGVFPPASAAQARRLTDSEWDQ
jgi:hypothetical protein